MTHKFNCIAIDDEPLALQLVESYIKRTPFLNLIGTYGSAEEAMPTIQNEKNIFLVVLYRHKEVIPMYR